MWKFIKWLFILVILLLVVVFIGLPLLANTEEGRKQLAKVLSDATNREVSLGELKVGLFYSSVDVGDLRIKNPEGFEGDFLNAGELNFDAKLKELLEGRVVGGLKGEGLDVKLITKNGRTNLEGFGGAEEAKDEKPTEEPKDEKKEPAPEEKKKSVIDRLRIFKRD